jgi:glycosyltransferase involved in cell wall biosynthesis
MKDILIVYQNIQHYRIPIFSLLMQEQNHGLRYTIASDIHGRTDIETVSETLLREHPTDGKITFLRLKNHWHGNFLWQSGLLKAILSGKYDVFIFLGDAHYTSTWIATMVARLLGKRTYFWAHAFIRGMSIQDLLKRIFFRLPHGLFLYGERAKENLTRLGFDPARMKVIYNSLDYDKQMKIRSQLTAEKLRKTKESLFSKDYPALLFIGRLTPQKKLGVLVELGKRLHNASMFCNLLFIGDGSEKKSLEETVRQHGLEDFVHFYGACHNEEELAPLIAMSDLCISPGEIGLTAMHSLVYGTPVITHDSYIHQMPEYESIAPGFNGDYYKYGDPDSLFEVTKNWLQGRVSRDTLRKRCYEVIDKKYNPYNQVKILRDELSH